MTTPIRDISLAAKELGQDKGTLIRFLFSKGFKPEDILEKTGLSREMDDALVDQFGTLEDNRPRGPKILGKIKLPADQRRVKEMIGRAKEKRLDILDLRNCGLTSLPREILTLKDQIRDIKLGDARRFTVVGRSANNIQDYSLLKEFKQLKRLSISGMELQSVRQITFLTQLEELDISNSSLADIHGIEELARLRNLNVSGNYLSLVSALAGLTSLKELDLSGNLLSDLQFLEPGSFAALETLELSDNQKMQSQLHYLENLQRLQVLELSGNELWDLDPLSVLPRLRQLVLSENQISDIRPLRKLKSLDLIDLSGNLLEDIDALRPLVQLKTILLKKNEISYIQSLRENVSVEKLDLSYNRLEACQPLEKLEKLKHLALDKNHIFNLDPLSKLTSLSFLSLSDNRIESIQPLAGLTELKFLNLRNNFVTDLLPLRPLLKKKKPNFRINIDKNTAVGMGWAGIYLFNNPIANPPQQYLAVGLQAILSYWDHQDGNVIIPEEKKKVNEAKLIIVGNSHAGKSTLSYLLENDQLPPEPLPSTHGLAFSTWTPTWTVKGEYLDINIIDFGGQEYYHDIHHLFFTNRAAYLLLWNPATNVNSKTPISADNQQGPELVRHFTVDYWLNAIGIYTDTSSPLYEEPETSSGEFEDIVEDGFDDEWNDEGYSEDSAEDELIENLPYREDVGDPYMETPVLLVQTHADKYGPTFLNLKDLQEKYPQLFGAVSVGMDVNTLSSSGIDVLQLYIKQMFESLSGGFDQEYFESWIDIRDYIEKYEKNVFHIFSISEFHSYFKNFSGRKNYSEEDIRILCITLDYWGVVLYKYNREDLKDIVVVNPQEFTRRVNSLLTGKVRDQKGLITRDHVLKIVESDQQKADSLLGILITFKILFRLPEKSAGGAARYISPMYLNERPDYAGLFLKNFVAYYRLRYEGYFHKGILLDCFSELGKELYFEQDYYFYWQWGMVLRRKERIICIEFDAQNMNQIEIRMIRNEKESLGQDPFLEHVLRSFQLINRVYNYELELSCDGTDFISRRQVLKAMKLGLTKFESQNKKYDVRDFFFLLPANEVNTTFKRVFISYSSKDRDYLDKLTAHLQLYKNARIIDYWDDLLLADREGWNEQIKDEMNRANILIMLLSPNYFATDYVIQEEIPIALKYLNEVNHTKRVFWVLLRPCNYELFDLSKYPIYPLKEKDPISGAAAQKAISEHEDQDREWVKLLGKILGETE